MRRYFWIVAIAACQWSCSHKDAQEALPNQASRMIIGHVFDKNSGKPVENACISLRADPLHQAKRSLSGMTAKTDSDGRFALKRPYTQKTHVRSILTIRHDVHAGKEVKVEWHDNTSIDLAPIMLPKGCMVSGRVIDLKGRPSWFDDVVLKKTPVDVTSRVTDISEVVMVTRSEGKYATRYPLSSGVWSIEIVSDLHNRRLTVQNGERVVIPVNTRSLRHDVVVDSVGN